MREGSDGMITIERMGNAVEVGEIVNNEIPTPAPDGAETVFTTANAYESGSLRVFRDQSSLLGGVGKDFEETTSTTFTVDSAPDADEELWVCYIKS